MFSSEVCLRLDKISGCCRRQYISGRGHTAGKQRATTVTVEKVIKYHKTTSEQIQVLKVKIT